jgi:cob(I)alamin adenosyltransferase
MAIPASRPKLLRGYVQVYTGNGKGKTTAALGLALRAAGWGYRTYIGQFLKGQSYGELRSVEALVPSITIEQFGRRGFVHVDRDPEEEDFRRAREGLDKCRRALLSGDYDLVVLDEVSVAVHFKLLSEEAILDLIEHKPEAVELVLTGRFAPASWLEKADLVTEMTEVKHYYNCGVRAREGIEK